MMSNEREPERVRTTARARGRELQTPCAHRARMPGNLSGRRPAREPGDSKPCAICVEVERMVRDGGVPF